MDIGRRRVPESRGRDDRVHGAERCRRCGALPSGACVIIESDVDTRFERVREAGTFDRGRHDGIFDGSLVRVAVARVGIQRPRQSSPGRVRVPEPARHRAGAPRRTRNSGFSDRPARHAQPRPELRRGVLHHRQRMRERPAATHGVARGRRAARRAAPRGQLRRQRERMAPTTDLLRGFTHLLLGRRLLGARRRDRRARRLRRERRARRLRQHRRLRRRLVHLPVRLGRQHRGPNRLPQEGRRVHGPQGGARVHGTKHRRGAGRLGHGPAAVPESRVPPRRLGSKMDAIACRRGGSKSWHRLR